MNQPSEAYPDSHRDSYSKTILGFWIYLLTDFVLFATLFATYAVLQDKVFGGPSAKDLFDPNYALIKGIVFLTSAFTIGMAGVSAHRQHKPATLWWMIATFLLGGLFIGLELNLYFHVIEAGHSWKHSAFLSAYFTLIGTHSAHVLFALLWILVYLFPIWRFGLTPVYIRRMICLKMFWQFLNIVWVFIFAVVYLLGVV